jgi:hypothetical protein
LIRTARDPILSSGFRDFAQGVRHMQTLKAMALSAPAGLLLIGLALWAVIGLGGDAITTVVLTSRDLHIVATVLVGMGALGLVAMFREPAAPEEPPPAFSLALGGLLALNAWSALGAITTLWVTAALAAISTLLIGGGLLGLWHSFPEPRSTGTVIRILLGALAIVVVFTAVYVAASLLGIERGEWRYALAIGIGIALAHLACSLLVPKQQPPPASG